ncbi:TonB-dependent receptor [bacterium]|nr:TonB-dependent receptor [bacterium]MBU1433564.1 TonB-dependent receptor [bacterium]MBU1503255.1 TonB-dependent receptor [bacterium]
MKKTIQLSLISVALLSSLSAEETVTLIPLSITSTAIETDELKATDAVEIYTQEDIEKAHVQNVYEFLNSQTSVITMPTYGNPFSQKMDIHGYGIGDGYQNIVVTLNGRKINNIDMVAPLLSSISPASISRIEIIKSGGIVTGGDGANAGVINITTKQNNDKELTVYGGNYGTYDGSLYLGHSEEKYSLSTALETKRHAGTRYIGDGDKDKNSLTNGSFDLTINPIDELELRAGASFARTNVIYASYLTEDEYNDNPSVAGATNWGSTEQEYDTNALSAGLTYFINNSLNLNVDASQEKKKSNYITYDYVSNYTYSAAKSTLEYSKNNLSLIGGIDVFNGERISGTKTTDKNNIAGFIMSNVSFGDSTLKAGYRFEQVTYKHDDTSVNIKDNHSLHGAELGYNYALDKEKSLFVNYAHSYQAPDIDRFFSYGVFNDFIEPMQANNYTLGFNHILEHNKFKASFYYIDLKDEIYYYSDLINSWPSPSLSVNTNIDKSHKYGIDIYDKWLINEEFNLALNYNYVQAIIDEETGRNGEDYSGNKLPGVSDHNIKATLSYLPTKELTLSLIEVYRSEAYAANDFANNFTQKQDPYNTTDISVTYAKKDFELFAKINNIFNQSNGLWIKDDAIYPVNFTTTAIAGLKLKF